MEPAKSAAVRVADSELYYETYGSGSPLILIHGDWADRRVWQPQIEAFSQAYQVVVYDLRGHGRSTVGDLPYSHVDDLLALLDRLGIAQAILAGHGLGGAVARAAAIEKPQRVAALILASIGSQGLFGVPIPDDELALYGRPLAAAHDGDTAAAVDLHESIWINGVRHEAPPEVRAAIRQIIEGYPFPEQDPHRPEVMWSTHTVPELHRVHLPVLLTWGLNDQPLIERASLMAADVLPDVHTGSIPDAAHYAHWEQAAEFNRIVLDFLAG